MCCSSTFERSAQLTERQNYSEFVWYEVTNVEIQKDLVKLEDKHPNDHSRCYKVGVILGKKGQTNPKEMFANGKVYFEL